MREWLACRTRPRGEDDVQGDLKNIERHDPVSPTQEDVWLPAGEPSIVDQIPARDAAVPEGGIVLVCPWMHGLPAASGPGLAALSIHDCNGYLEGATPAGSESAQFTDAYFGIFALDRLRSAESLFGLLRSRGVRNII